MLFKPVFVSGDVSKSVVMLTGTRQRINHCNMIVHISGQVLTQVPHTK